MGITTTTPHQTDLIVGGTATLLTTDRPSTNRTTTTHYNDLIVGALHQLYYYTLH